MSLTAPATASLLAGTLLLARHEPTTDARKSPALSAFYPVKSIRTIFIAMNLTDSVA